jgi:predicted Zn-dependent protease
MTARAGWDPAGISRSLRTLEREEALHGDAPRAMSFFATHPPLPRRVADTRDRAGELTAGLAGNSASPASFLRRLEGLPVGPRAADGVFEGSLFLHPTLDFHVRFPVGWQTVNERSIVGAVAPDHGAAIGLELVGNGDDPEAPLRDLERQTGTSLSHGAERFAIGGLPAVRTAAVARTRNGPIAVDLTWIAFGGQLYRVTGITRPTSLEAVRPLFGRTAGSFGAVTAEERASIHETRLRLVTARDGESLGGLLTRAHSAWSPEVAAVANGVDAAAPLAPGRLVKVAVVRPYASR